jgi:chemoreceptor-like protein with four helix bundle sensory module
MFRTIHQKILAGFGVVLALLLAAVVLSLHGMSTMSTEAADLAGEDVPAVQALGELRNGLNTMRSTELDTINAPTPQVKKIASAVYAQARAESAAALKTYARSPS